MIQKLSAVSYVLRTANDYSRDAVIRVYMRLVTMNCAGTQLPTRETSTRLELIKASQSLCDIKSSLRPNSLSLVYALSTVLHHEQILSTAELEAVL